MAGGEALPKTSILASYWQTDQGLRALSAGLGGASPAQVLKEVLRHLTNPSLSARLVSHTRIYTQIRTHKNLRCTLGGWQTLVPAGCSAKAA